MRAGKDFHKILGKNIMLARKEKGLTQADLAQKSDIERSFISQIENGGSKIGLETLVKIASALEVTVGSLLGESEAPPSAAFDPSDVDSFLTWCDRYGFDPAKQFKKAVWLFQQIGKAELSEIADAMAENAPVHVRRFTPAEQAEYDETYRKMREIYEKIPEQPDESQSGVG